MPASQDLDMYFLKLDHQYTKKTDLLQPTLQFYYFYTFILTSIGFVGVLER